MTKAKANLDRTQKSSHVGNGEISPENRLAGARVESNPESRGANDGLIQNCTCVPLPEGVLAIGHC